MADNDKQKLTAKERQIAKIEQLKAQLQKEEAKLRAEARKERTAQLVALGIYAEINLREIEQKKFDTIVKDMKKIFKGRTLENALAGMARLAKEREELAKKTKEVSPEPVEQLPEPSAEKVKVEAEGGEGENP